MSKKDVILTTTKKVAKHLPRQTFKAFTEPEAEKEITLILRDALRQRSPKIYQALLSGESRDTMIKMITEVVDQASGFAATYTDTGLSIIGRERIANSAKDLGLFWYRYIGGEIKTSRDFCIERDGGYYHEEEIKDWADEEWDGKIDGTTEETIFSFCGGWNCRHDLIPVIESSVPDSDIERFAARTTKEFANNPEVEIITSPADVSTNVLENYDTNAAFDRLSAPPGNEIPLLKRSDMEYSLGNSELPPSVAPYVSPQEADMLRLYTGGDYTKMTTYLKTGETKDFTPETMATWERGMEASLNKLPPHGKGELYRVERFNEDRLKGYLSGKPITNTNFWSTSYDTESAFFDAEIGGPFTVDKEIKSNALRIVIKPSQNSLSKNISAVSNVVNEMEVLYPRGTEFKLLKYDDKFNVLYIEEILKE